jgi:tetratricopeptide (TPR) repeat protein
VILLAFAWGVHRYGSADDFRLRINAEVEAHRPHPLYAPTPLAPYVAAGIADLAVSEMMSRATASATPGATPSPTATSRQESALLDSPVRIVAPRVTAGARQPTPTPAIPPAPTPSPDFALPAQVRLTGLRHNWQTWNNCGPATLAMNLSFFGSKLSQADVAAVLRPYRDDKNVSPEEMAAYARANGLQASVRVNGDAERLKLLLAAGVPVLLETWYEPKPNDGMGHYRLLVGYDDAQREWIAYDSYDGRGLKKNEPYTGIRLPYDEIAKLWEAFNRTYVILYDGARAAAVSDILGADADDTAMWAAALEKARTTALAQPENAFAWFNAGSTLVEMGRYEDAAQMYDHARRVGLPWRMMWYQFGPFEAYYETGRYDEVIALANATLRNAQIEELYYWRGLAQQAKGDVPAARESWRRALELNPNYAPVRERMQTLDASSP